MAGIAAEVRQKQRRGSRTGGEAIEY